MIIFYSFQLLRTLQSHQVLGVTLVFCSHVQLAVSNGHWIRGEVYAEGMAIEHINLLFSVNNATRLMMRERLSYSEHNMLHSV